MATRVTAFAPLLELAGRPVAALRSLQLPGYEVETVVAPIGPGGTARLAANVGLTNFDAELDLPTAPGPLLDWVLSLTTGRVLPMDGAGLVLDANFGLRRRVLWTEGLLTQLRWPVLDAQDKTPLALGLAWTPGAVAYAPVAGEQVRLPPVKGAKRLLACNFRLAGLPFDGASVSRVALPTVQARVASENTGQARVPQRHLASVDLGEVAVSVNSRGRDEALAWVLKAVADGRIGDADQLTLQAQLLDPALKNALATLTLSGCMLLGCREDRLGAGSEQAGGLTLRFAVGQLAFASA